MTRRWVWSLLLVAVLATIASAAPPPPPPPPNPEIVYVESGTNPKIVVMNNDGSNKTVVWNGPQFNPMGRPVFSPSCQWIAVAVGGTGLYLIERATGTATVLLSNTQCGANCFILYPRFSPTGDRIAVIASPGNFGNIYRVLAVPLTGGTPQLLYTGPAGVTYADAPAWSTDETRIALLQYPSGSIGSKQIHVVDLQAQTERTIVETPPGYIRRIDWARNNVDRIAFDADTTIWTVDFTASSVSSPVLVSVDAVWPGFSPDNSYIVARRKISNNKWVLAKRHLATGVWTDLGNGQDPDWKR